MKLFRIFTLLFLIFIFFFSINKFVQAGFGISPPRVTNHLLNRGSFFEQKIVLSRGQPDQDLKAEITVEPSEIDSWITIKPSKEFVLPKGQQQVPMFVRVDIPKDAAYKNYQTDIKVKTSVNNQDDSQIKIALGALINVDLTVTDKIYIDFLVKTVRISENFIKAWPLSLFNRIKAVAKIENLGNTSGAPTMMQLEIYDINQKKILETTDDYSLEEIEPFQTKEIVGEFPTKLSAGQYWAKLKIFKADELKYEDKILVTLKKVSFSFLDWLLIAGGGLIILGIILILVLFFRKRKKLDF